MPGLSKKPVKQIPRRLAPQILPKIKEEIERLLKCDFIRTARYVDWLANVVPVKKKNGTIRVCIDFRDLNLATPKDEYPMPVAEMLVDSTVGFEYLSMLDGYSGYNQIFIAEEDISKTAFRCPGGLGCYEWLVMPFGLKNVGATFQRAMNSMFHDFIEDFMQVYIDDIVVKSSSEDRHLEHFRRSFERMSQYELKMNPLKCVFGVCSGDFFRFCGSQERNRNKPEQNQRNNGDQTSFNEERVAILVRKDQLSQKVHIKAKWQSTSFFAIDSFEGRRRVQVGAKTPKGF